MFFNIYMLVQHERSFIAIPPEIPLLIFVILSQLHYHQTMAAVALDNAYAVGSKRINIFRPNCRQNYRHFVRDLRGIFRTQAQYDRNTGALLASSLYNINIGFNRKTLQLKLRTQDFYMLGFSVRHEGRVGPLWEMRTENDPAMLQGSRPLGFQVNYPTGDGLVGNPIGWRSLENAVTTLIDAEDPDRCLGARGSLVSIIFMLIEACRFKWMEDTFNRIVLSPLQGEVEDWMVYLVQRWELLSSYALYSPQDVILTEEELAYVNGRDISCFDSMPMASRIARNCVLVLHGDFRPM